jgi:serine/threonine-protein kinase RsbW
MTPFDMTHELESRACVVRLTGDLDMAVVPELREGLDQALGAGCENVVLDLDGVVYADSSALGLLVWLDHRLRPIGGRLVIAGASGDVSRVLELSGLVSVAVTIAMSGSVVSALEGLELADTPSEQLWQREIPVEPDVNALARVREQVCDTLAPLGFTESALFDIKVALGEALANAIRHGAPLEGASEILVRVGAYPERIVLEIQDNGEGFDGTHSGSEDLYAPGGRGIMFMRALMDRVEYETPPYGGTLVRLTKHRPHAA